jgi:hypothetical protein
VPPPTTAGPPPASPPRAPRRPIGSPRRLPGHHSTAAAALRPNHSPILTGPGDHSGRANSPPPPSPPTSNPHSTAPSSRLPHPRDFVPWRFSDACRRGAHTPASPRRRPTNLHRSRHFQRSSSSSASAFVGPDLVWTHRSEPNAGTHRFAKRQPTVSWQGGTYLTLALGWRAPGWLVAPRFGRSSASGGRALPPVHVNRRPPPHRNGRSR